MTLQVFVEGTGVIEAAALTDAVAAAAGACPGARVVRQGKFWVDSGRSPEVRVLDGAALNRGSFDNLPELHRSLRGDGGGPMTEVVQLTGARPAMVFRSHHSVMDAGGLLLWVAEVFRALRGEHLQPRSTRSAG
jgi:hypothetical protein